MLFSCSDYDRPTPWRAVWTFLHPCCANTASSCLLTLHFIQICVYLTQFHETHYCYGLSRLIRNLLDCGFSNFFLLFLFLSHPI